MPSERELARMRIVDRVTAARLAYDRAHRHALRVGRVGLPALEAASRALVQAERLLAEFDHGEGR